MSSAPVWSPMCRIYKAAQGLTLTELIITLVFLTLLLGAIWMIFDSVFRPFYSQEKRTDIKEEAGLSFYQLAQDLRHATSVTNAQQTNITFTADIDDDGDEDTVQYNWSGTVGAPLQRIADVTVPLVSAVNSLSFSYYNASDSLLSSPVSASQVRAVAVDLTAKTQDETFQLRSRTRLRNLS